VVGNGRIIRKIDCELDEPQVFAVTSRYPFVGAEIALTAGSSTPKLAVHLSIPGIDIVELTSTFRGRGLFADFTRSLRIPPTTVREYSLHLSTKDSDHKVRVQGELRTDFQFAPRSHTHIAPGRNLFLAAVAPTAPLTSGEERGRGVIKLSWVEPGSNDAINNAVY
jgi:hypothetical protein